MQKVDISSTALESGLEIAKGFIEKLIYPSVEEMGLLLKDGIAKWRFANQVRTVVQAQKICEKHGVNPQMISPKLLAPLLEYASLEDNEKLQEKWSTLLANMVDSDQNVESHVFPYLLSQVSIQEFEILELALNIKIERVRSLNVELEEHMSSKDEVLADLAKEIEGRLRAIEEIRRNNLLRPGSYTGFWSLENELGELLDKKSSLEAKQGLLQRAIDESELITQIGLRDYEIANLIRLGVVRERIRSYGYLDSQRVPLLRAHDYELHDYVSLDDLSVTIETDVIEYELTELGELFVKACQEKRIPTQSSK